MFDSLWSHGLQPTGFLCPWNSPGKNTGMGCHTLLQELFPTQGLNLGLTHCRQTLYWVTREDLSMRFQYHNVTLKIFIFEKERKTTEENQGQAPDGCLIPPHHTPTPQRVTVASSQSFFFHSNGEDGDKRERKWGEGREGSPVCMTKCQVVQESL